MYKVDFERRKSEFLKIYIAGSKTYNLEPFFHTNVYLLSDKICITLLSNETHETQFKSANFLRNALNSYFFFAYVLNKPS